MNVNTKVASCGLWRESVKEKKNHILKIMYSIEECKFREIKKSADIDRYEEFQQIISLLFCRFFNLNRNSL